MFTIFKVYDIIQSAGYGDRKKFKALLYEEVMKKPKVSIIILNWNGLEDTIECLNSIKKITYPNYEVIVVDNGSSGNDVQVLRKKFGSYIKIIKNKKNEGFAEGNNIAIRRVMKENKSKYVLLLNNDTVVDKKFLDELVKVAESDDKIGIVGPVIRNYYTKEIDFAGGKINWWLGRPYHLKKIDPREYTDFITGCCMLIPIEKLKKVGLFDKMYFTYFEDSDLCERIKKLGFKLKIIEKSKLIHKVSKSTGKKGLYNYYFARNRITFNEKYNSGARLYFFLFFQRYIKRFFAKLLLEKEDYKMWRKGLSK